MSGRFTRLAVLTVSCFALAVGTAGAATITNGDFSAGLDGWQTQSDAGSDVWKPYSSLSDLINAGVHPSSMDVPAPFGTSAVADPGDPMSTILYRDIALEAGSTHTLSLSYFALNDATDWNTPTPLSYSSTGDSKQIGAVDVIKASAAADTTSSSDVLATVWRSAPGQLRFFGWTDATIDLSAFAGQTVRLRAIDVNNQGPLVVGLDNVAIKSVDVTSPSVSGISTKSASYTEGAKNAGFSRGFTASEAGTLTATFSKLTKGRKSGKSCVKKTAKNSPAKSCNYWAALKTAVTQPVIAGANTFKFDGKLGGKKLKAGKYKVTLTVKDSTGNAAAPVTIKFTVKAKKKKK